MEATKEFGGRSYAFGVLPTTEAVEVEVLIAKAIGEPAFKAIMELNDDEKSAGADKLTKERMLAIGGMAIGLITSRMDAKELIHTMRMVLKYVSCDSKRVEFESHFTGKNKELWQVFIYALRFNFSDFFPESLSPLLGKTIPGL